eukprot:TRINITY_DN11845_c0_g1_i1.p2 TRINITY_DN11845_c0_g1~~TRINITY_DN11845_c0_g1_i1.p2  ORF type:complete len:285 (+),score=59.56 TRINITY_DN11845_c0_g1_i1:112-855(+)
MTQRTASGSAAQPASRMPIVCAACHGPVDLESFLTACHHLVCHACGRKSNFGSREARCPVCRKPPPVRFMSLSDPKLPEEVRLAGKVTVPQMLAQLDRAHSWQKMVEAKRFRMMAEQLGRGTQQVKQCKEAGHRLALQVNAEAKRYHQLGGNPRALQAVNQQLQHLLAQTVQPMQQGGGPGAGRLAGGTTPAPGAKGVSMAPPPVPSAPRMSQRLSTGMSANSAGLLGHSGQLPSQCTPFGASPGAY